jgi:hypothetical protein
MISGSDQIAASVSMTLATASIAAITSSISRLNDEISTDDTDMTLATASIAAITASISRLDTETETNESNITLATASIAAITASINDNLDQAVKTDSNVTFGTVSSGDITSTGTITAVEVHTTFVSSSIAVASGSNNFGDAVDDHHSFTGSLSVSGSGTITGSLTVEGSSTIDELTATTLTGTTIKDFSTISGSVTSTGSFGSIAVAGTGISTFTGGNVGIGTTGPSSLLELSGTGNILSTITSTNNGNVGVYLQRTAKGSDAYADFSVNNNGGVFNISSHRSDVDVEALTIEHGGNVGIGVSNPGEFVSVWNSTPSSDVYLQVSSSGAGKAAGIKLVTSQDSSRIYFGSPGNPDDGMIKYSDPDNTGAGKVMSFIAGDSTRMVISGSTGYVGIGTDSPSGDLHIEHASDDNTKLFIQAGGNTRDSEIYFGDQASETIGRIQYDHSTDAMSFNVNASERMRITSAGDVGIGTTGPDSLLHIYGSGDMARVDAADGTNAAWAIAEGGSLRWSMYNKASDNSFNIYKHHNSAADVLTLNEEGNCGIGGDPGSNQRLYVLQNSQNNWTAYFRHDGNTDARYGCIFQNGQDDPTGTNYAIRIQDGDGDLQGDITFSGGTVSYGTFTAHHEVSLPTADADSEYPYGTLVEIVSIYYKQKNGADSERGIRYNVKKTSSKYSKKVLGAYAGSMNNNPQEETNLHMVDILGDGHILCNGEKGNIEIGDGICSSSTEGQGMKADQTTMIIGIAQEDVSFSGSESKLVVVQYGLQQFTPWS